MTTHQQTIACWYGAVLGLLACTTAHAQLNISTRGHVGQAEEVLIAGFIVADSNYNVLVVRGLSTSLRGLVTEPLLIDPYICLYNQDGNLIALQDSYLENNAVDLAFLEAKGLTPAYFEECALIVPIAAGQVWTVVLRGRQVNENGMALIEGYYFKR